ncbi:MAG: DUF2125 domain-containing protein [Tateyamaria sp.]|uniref:DUF2125 domain-containing protein n=1 Tax=Tateyamaria sp. TaxID=1929288 RepID=UPI0032916D91
MPRVSLLARSTAIALCMTATAAFADLSGADVWADWKSYMESNGYDVTASEITQGNTLTVNDMTLEFDLSKDVGDGTVAVTMDTVRFVEQGDGSVAMELPALTSIDIETTTVDGDTFAATVTYEQTDPVMTATGDPDALTYDYKSPKLSMELADLTVNGTPISSDVARIGVNMTDIAYTLKTSVAELRNIEQAMTLGALGYDLAFADPEGDGNVKLAGEITGITVSGSGDLPTDSNPNDLNAMLNDGLGFQANLASVGGNFSLSFSSPDGSGTANSASEGGEINLAIDTDGLLYNAMQRNVDFNMLVTEFPLPLSFSANEVGTGIVMPLQKAPEEQGFGFNLSLGDFTMSDVIWSLFDPSNQLPRDPASLLVDLSGKAKVLFDFLDPTQALVLEQTGAAPGELNALTLNKLELDAAGAKLTGSGDFTFDNSDLTTFDGVPRPLGGLDLSLVGGNGLLDKLVAMGLVPEQQAMGARLMMGLFAVPGDAPDTLDSRIEINPEGHVLANGQRIR